jgi:hypothetical protein
MPSDRPHWIPFRIDLGRYVSYGSRLCENLTDAMIPLLNRGGIMKGFVEGADRQQTTLLPECLDDWVDESNPVRAVDVFVDALELLIRWPTKAQRSSCWSIGPEYDHLWMGNANNSFSVADPRLVAIANDRISQDVDMVTLRINYRFGWGAGPITAHY